MSYLRDKKPCKGACGLLFDEDQLNEEGKCRWCVMDDIFVRDEMDDDIDTDIGGEFD